MKKLLSVLLGLSIIASTTAVFAKDDQGLEKALGEVKKITEIKTDNYDAFNYSVFEENNKKFWYFSWDGDDESAYAQYREDGILLSYDRYRYFDDNNWSEMPKSEAREIAETFLKRIGEKFFNSLALEQESRNGRTINFQYAETVNGIKVHGKFVNIDVDCIDKEVIRFSREVPSDKTFERADKYLSKDEAFEKFKSNNEMKLVYKTKYNYHTEQNEVHLAYVLKDRSNVGINAITGEKCEYSWYEPYEDGMRSNDAEEAKEMATAEMDNAYSEFSEQEVKEIEENEKLITKEKAVEILTNAFSLRSLSINYTSLNKLYPKGNYIWQISLKGGTKKEPRYVSGIVNAKSGEIISFSDNREPVGKKDIGSDTALEMYNDFIGKNAPDRVELLGEPEVSEQKTGDFKYYLVTASRIENGIDVEYDNIMMAFASTGKIAWYNCMFTDDIEFPPLEDIISEDEIFEKYVEATNFDMQYVYVKNKYVPVYDIDNKNIEINPQTGKKILEDYEQETITGYDDISGHWCENAVTKLIDNGFTLAGTSFEPEREITTKEFLNYANIIYGDYDEDVDNYLKELRRKAPEIGEISSDSILTRKQAAIIVCHDMGYSDLARVKDLFKTPFVDMATDDALGYVAICKGRKVFAGDSTQNFNPQGKVTRAQAAQIIYMYISNK